MSKPHNKGANGYDVVNFPDVTNRPKIDQKEQHEVMVEAANQRGRLANGEYLTALPAGSAPPSGGRWQKEGGVTARRTGHLYDVYVMHDGQSKDGADGKSPQNGNEVNSRRQPPGQQALQDIDRSFSPNQSPTSSTAKCVLGFAEGFVEGAVVGLATGFILSLLGSVGVAIGSGLLLYSIYETVKHWDEIKALPDEEKARLIGGVIGGVVGGALGARGGLRLRTRLGKPPKGLGEIDRGRQNIHKPGTNEYTTRSNSPKGKPTAWKDPAAADDTTLEAYKKGRVMERYPDGKPKEVKWDAKKPVGENGETGVTVKLKQNGKLHGFPSGKKTP